MDSIITTIEYKLIELTHLRDKGTSKDYQMNGLSMTLDEKQAYFMGQITALTNVLLDLKRDQFE